MPAATMVMKSFGPTSSAIVRTRLTRGSAAGVAAECSMTNLLPQFA